MAGFGFRQWRRKRILARSRLDETAWRETLSGLSCLRGLNAEERARLKDWVVLFLADKTLSGAGGLLLDEAMRLAIAAQACLLILNRDLDWYDGFAEVIVYPDEFVPEYEYTDDIGLVHRVRMPMTGEAWPGGPVILSWEDARGAHGIPGYNVVIHEFAHKLDLAAGEANGCPLLPREMSRHAWAQAFGRAYEDFCGRVAAGEDTAIDPYAAETPGEFFAVLSEAFFEAPWLVSESYPEVYEQLKAFYRQDPSRRLPARRKATPN